MGSSLHLEVQVKTPFSPNRKSFINNSTQTDCQLRLADDRLGENGLLWCRQTSPQFSYGFFGGGKS